MCSNSWVCHSCNCTACHPATRRSHSRFYFNTSDICNFCVNVSFTSTSLCQVFAKYLQCASISTTASITYTNHSASHIPDYVPPAVHSHRRRHSVTSVSHSGETLAQRKCHTLQCNWPSVTLCTEVVCQALASSDRRQPISHLSCSLAGRKSDTRTLITYTGTFLAGIVQRTMGWTSIQISRYHQK